MEFQLGEEGGRAGESEGAGPQVLLALKAWAGARGSSWGGLGALGPRGRRGQQDTRPGGLVSGGESVLLVAPP